MTDIVRRAAMGRPQDRRFVLVNARCLRLKTLTYEAPDIFADGSGAMKRVPPRIAYHSLELLGAEVVYVDAYDAEAAVQNAPYGGLWLVFDAETGECCTGEEV